MHALLVISSVSPTCYWRIYFNVCFPSASISVGILRVGIVKYVFQFSAKINKVCFCSLFCTAGRDKTRSYILKVQGVLVDWSKLKEGTEVIHQTSKRPLVHKISSKSIGRNFIIKFSHEDYRRMWWTLCMLGKTEISRSRDLNLTFTIIFNLPVQ